MNPNSIPSNNNFDNQQYNSNGRNQQRGPPNNNQYQNNNNNNNYNNQQSQIDRGEPLINGGQQRNGAGINKFSSPPSDYNSNYINEGQFAENDIDQRGANKLIFYL